MDITELLAFARKNSASDLHISALHPPVLRIHGDMMPLKVDKLSSDQVKSMIYAVMTESQRAEFERELEHDFSVQFGDDMRFRANAFNTGCNLVGKSHIVVGFDIVNRLPWTTCSPLTEQSI